MATVWWPGAHPALQQRGHEGRARRLVLALDDLGERLGFLRLVVAVHDLGRGLQGLSDGVHDLFVGIQIFVDREIGAELVLVEHRFEALMHDRLLFDKYTPRSSTKCSSTWLRITQGWVVVAARLVVLSEKVQLRRAPL